MLLGNVKMTNAMKVLATVSNNYFLMTQFDYEEHIHEFASFLFISHLRIKIFIF